MNTQATETETIAYNTAEFMTLFNKGLERVVAVSKSYLDLAIEQNSEVLASYKEAMEGSSLPGTCLFDLAGQAFENYVTLQKSLLGLAVEQSTSVINAAQVCQDASKAKDEISNLIQQSVERSVAAQTSVMDFATKQSKAASETIKQQSSEVAAKGEKLTQSAQRGVDTVVAAQKEILNAATKSIKPTTSKA
jgi:hypothetical protein